MPVYTPASPSAPLSAKEVEVDVGAAPTTEADVIVTDAASTVASKCLAWMSFNTPTGKDADDVSSDNYAVHADVSTAGQITFRIFCLTGVLHDKYKIQYLLL